MTNNDTLPKRKKRRRRLRLWANLSMRAKLIIVFLTVTIVAVGLVAVLNIQNTSTALREQTGGSLASLAESVGQDLGATLTSRVVSMQSYAQDPELLEDLATQNGSYSGGTEAILATLIDLDEQWIAASDSDPLVTSRLTSDLAAELDDFKSIVIDFAEIFATDQYGGLVASSDRTSDYYQADEGWWQAAYDGGRGAVFVADPELDESTGVIGVDIAVPVYGLNNQVIGIMRSTLDVTSLIDRLSNIELGQTGGADLVVGEELFEAHHEEHEADDTAQHHALSPALLARMAENEVGYEQQLFDEQPALVGYAAVASLGGEEYIQGLGWKVILHQAESEALTAVAQQTLTTALIALAVAGVAAAAAIFLGTTLATPILRLTEMVTKFTTGDLDARVDVQSGDEIGTLGTNFNQMAEQVGGLMESIRARGRELEERTRELEASQRVTFAASERATPEELLGLVVNLIRDQFDLYHVQMYLVDKEANAAVLRESTGYAGRQLLQRKHQIPLDQVSLVTRSINEVEPVLVADTTQDPNFLPNPLLPETKSELVVPLKLGDRVLGALDAQSRVPDRFSESTIALFQAMTDQLAFLFERSEYLDQLTDQTEVMTVFTNQLRTAADIARRLGSILDPEQLLQQVVELIQSRFGLYHAHIYVVDEKVGKLVLRAGSGEVGQVLRDRGHSIEMGNEKSLVARAAREHQAVLVNDTTLESDYMPNPLLPQTRSEVSVPLISGDTIIGVLDVQDDQPDRFSQADVDTFGTLAGQVATALQTAALFEQVRESEARFRDVSVASSDWIWETDSEGRYTHVSEKIIDVLGYTAEETVGKTPFDTMPPEEAARVGEIFADIVAKKQNIVDLENRNITKDGREVYLLTSGVPILDDSGNLLGYRGVDRDITELKQATEMFQTVADFTYDWEYWLSPDQSYRYVSPACQRITGYSVDEFTGDPRLLEMLIHPDDRSAFAEHMRDFHHAGSKETAEVEFRITARDSSVRWIGHTCNPVHTEEGEWLGRRASNREITAAKQAEEERERFTTQLRVASDLAEQINAILDPDQLMREVVNQLQSRFDFYHAHIYLLDRRSGQLRLRAGSGEAGRIMIEQGHAIAMNHERSIVASAAREREEVVIANTTVDPSFLPNPLLPETRAEAAVPLLFGDQVLGVLDVQDNQVGRFGQSDVDVLTTIAGQVATALQNADLFGQTEVRLRVSQAMAGTQTEEEVLNAIIQQAGIYPQAQIVINLLELPDEETLEMQYDEPAYVIANAASFESRITPAEIGSRFLASQFPILDLLEPGEPFVIPNLLLDDRIDPATRQYLSRLGNVSLLVLPLRVGDEEFGFLRAGASVEGFFDERRMHLYQTLAEQGAMALRTARLYEETQSRAEWFREVDVLKSEFLANMSHELRTPLNSIIGYTEIMLMGIGQDGEEHDNGLDPDTLEDIQAIYDNGQHLLRIINDVLDLSKLEAGRMELEMEEVHIAPLFEEIKTANAGLLVSKPVEIVIDVEQRLPTVEADRTRLAQIMNNLVSNAVKFTEEGAITLRGYSDEDYVCLAVEDTGIGMSREDLNDVFERFTQADGSYTRRAEGTGLGLSITRHLVELHEGMMEVESELGVGSTFTVRLPSLRTKRRMGKSSSSKARRRIA